MADLREAIAEAIEHHRDCLGPDGASLACGSPLPALAGDAGFNAAHQADAVLAILNAPESPPR